MAAKRLLAVSLISLVIPTASTEIPSFSNLQDHETANSVPAYSFTNRTTIYAPVNNQTVGYPRVTELSDGSVLVACTLSGNFPGYFPIFKSTDGGVTWNWLSNVGGNSTLRNGQTASLAKRQGIKVWQQTPHLPLIF